MLFPSGSTRYRPITAWRHAQQLPGDVTADVAIVGAGYTGLWTAYYLKQIDPSLRVVVVEAEFAGFGASGRNGGWLSALLPMSFETMAEQHGRDRRGRACSERCTTPSMRLPG